MKQFTKISVSMLLTIVLIALMLPVSVSAAEPTIAYYGRDALSQQADAEILLYIYDQMVDGVANTATEIPFERSYGITAEQLNTAVDAYTRDHTEHFWLGTRYTYSYYPDAIVSLFPTYTLTGSYLSMAKDQFENAANEILAGLDDTMSDYTKELYIHDALAAKVEYQEGTHAHDAYGALVEGIAVCEGYAEALQYLLHRAGIRSFIALGDADGEAHAWNYVEIDEEFYHVDLTWDDQDSTLYHEYFNQTDATIRETHNIDAAGYELPVCDAQDAFYFYGKAACLDTYTPSEVAKLLRNNSWQVHVYIPGDTAEFLAWYKSNIRQIATEAGVTTGFGYGYGKLSREFVLQITNAGEPPRQVLCATFPDGTTANYAFPEDAIADCAASGGSLKLIADCTRGFAVNAPCTLDLNGFDLTGSITGTSTLVLLDSQTDDFNIEDSYGYGKVTSQPTAPVKAAEGYVKITEDDGVSFHKVDLTIKSMGLRPAEAGLYFKSDFAGDQVVARNVDSFGVALSVTGSPDETTLENPLHFTRFEKESFGTGADNTSTLLTGILKETNGYNTNTKNANIQVYGRAYIEIDGEYTFGVCRNRSMVEQLEGIDAQWHKLTEAQIPGIQAMYNTYKQVMQSWNLPNLKASVS